MAQIVLLFAIFGNATLLIGMGFAIDYMLGTWGIFATLAAWMAGVCVYPIVKCLDRNDRNTARNDIPSYQMYNFPEES